MFNACDGVFRAIFTTFHRHRQHFLPLSHKNELHAKQANRTADLPCFIACVIGWKVELEAVVSDAVFVIDNLYQVHFQVILWYVILKKKHHNNTTSASVPAPGV